VDLWSRRLFGELDGTIQMLFGGHVISLQRSKVDVSLIPTITSYHLLSGSSELRRRRRRPLRRELLVHPNGVLRTRHILSLELDLQLEEKAGR
jgi:hypothetical protein